MQLAGLGGSFTSDPAALVTDGMPVATMNARATRFLYLTNAGSNGVRQLATLDLNPTSLGDAPSLTGASIEPDFLLSQGRSGSTVQAQVSTASRSSASAAWS